MAAWLEMGMSIWEKPSGRTTTSHASGLWQAFLKQWLFYCESREWLQCCLNELHVCVMGLQGEYMSIILILIYSDRQMLVFAHSKVSTVYFSKLEEVISELKLKFHWHYYQPNNFVVITKTTKISSFEHLLEIVFKNLYFVNSILEQKNRKNHNRRVWSIFISWSIRSSIHPPTHPFI